MNLKHIKKTNKKGQIVIPKEIREKLGISSDVPLQITSDEGGIYIYPIESVITSQSEEDAYEEVLEKTKGAWEEDNWEEARKKRRQTEKQASKNRKNQW